MGLKFEWDPSKGRSNEQKHGVTFEEAQSVFFDECAMLIADPDHSEGEERFVIMGMSSSRRALIVCHCYRKSESAIRIISARKATRRERLQYEEKFP